MKQFLKIYCFLMLSIPHLLSQSGLKADYFDGQDFNRYVTTEYVENIDFYWNKTPPVPGINPHKCSIRYTGQLKAPKTGVINFTARVDDGIRVWIDEVLIIDNWRLNDRGYSAGKVTMIADSVYNLKIEYFNALIEAELRLLWTLPNDIEKSWYEKWWSAADVPQIIPAAYFLPPIEAKVAAEPVLPPIVETTPKPQPKPKVISKPKKVQPKPAVVVQKEPKVGTIQRYLPKNVAFNQAESKILPVSYPELDKLANFLVRHPAQKVSIEGHTDNVGNAEKNLLLSEKRAYAVAAYLVKKGVNPKQLSAKGLGGTQPLFHSKDKKYHPENRRVAFVIE